MSVTQVDAATPVDAAVTVAPTHRSTRAKKVAAPVDAVSVTTKKYVVSYTSNYRGCGKQQVVLATSDTETEAVKLAVKRMIKDNLGLMVDLITGADSDPDLNPKGKNITRKLIDETNSFNDLGKLCRKYGDSYFRDSFGNGWDIYLKDV